LGVVDPGVLIAGLSLQGNAALAARAAGESKAAALERADGLLRRVGLAKVVARRAGEVGGADRLRCAVAVAFARDPELVLADEPAGSLGQADAHAVLELVFGLAGERDAAVLAVPRDLYAAAKVGAVIHIVEGNAQ
jgi:predicted ABC-type transport system involved in lysophospholipase L1 biosynthesis ATPase subunit